jgi:hypothetical protein
MAVVSPPNPPSPGLYCDPLWNATLTCFPATGPVTGTARLQLNSRYDGITWQGLNPNDEGTMITNINNQISIFMYGTSNDFDCRTMCRPSRYVIMGGLGGVFRSDELYVAADGTRTYTQTDWRIPPNYLPQ